ncbi:DUF6296 family protein [Kitasatospora sp. NPDC101157]|uniref:DUF6296 family protein n=1 Tax=Kitasatospora sp. NPDC101157 TaxID=3364098 RepID=UPI00381CE127
MHHGRGPVHRPYAVTLPGPVGMHARPRAPGPSGDVAPGGGHVGSDATGHWRLHNDGETATVLSTPAEYDSDGHPLLHAVPMP